MSNRHHPFISTLPNKLESDRKDWNEYKAEIWMVVLLRCIHGPANNSYQNLRSTDPSDFSNLNFLSYYGWVWSRSKEIQYEVDGSLYTCEPQQTVIYGYSSIMVYISLPGRCQSWKLNNQWMFEWDRSMHLSGEVWVMRAKSIWAIDFSHLPEIIDNDMNL